LAFFPDASRKYSVLPAVVLTKASTPILSEPSAIEVWVGVTPAGNGGAVAAVVAGAVPNARSDAAVDAVAFGAFFNQGQICMSTERVIVQEAVADAFLGKLVAKARTLRAGDPTDPGSVLGAMVSEQAVRSIAALVDDARAQGARLPLGLHSDGAILQPVIVDGILPGMKLYREESFGPVVTVARARDDDAAIAMANDSDYGLAAAVFSRDVSRALNVAQRIESGICHINGPTVHDEAQMPFGGVKSSGYGRFGSKASVAEFTELRWITVQNAPRHYPI
jgi:acyl-CoA reductase-like NAD-dependent aldehyde dehydrogenase